MRLRAPQARKFCLQTAKVCRNPTFFGCHLGLLGQASRQALVFFKYDPTSENLRTPYGLCEKIMCVCVEISGYFSRNLLLVTQNVFLEKCRSEKPEILDSITTSGKIDESTEKSLNELITDLKKNLKS